jgi:two-component system, OmpR family, response regulator TctD
MRILLAEDEPELATWLVRALQQTGFQVDWVDDGRLVRRSLKAITYDALILDLGLPGWAGTKCWPICAKPTSACPCWC